MHAFKWVNAVSVQSLKNINVSFDAISSSGSLDVPLALKSAPLPFSGVIFSQTFGLSFCSSV